MEKKELAGEDTRALAGKGQTTLLSTFMEREGGRRAKR